ncbi:MAG: hypothetical protein ACRDNZ_15630 [Streptosporangiaceae bacterium]
MTGPEPGAATGVRPGAGGQEAWLGYTLGELTQIARRAAVYCRWGDRFALPERFEIAWTGVVDYLAGCDSSPEPFEVYKAGMRAIGRTGERELREHGVTRGAEGLAAMPRFEAYWAPRATPGADVRVVERVALWQIWAMLRPLHQLALLALAAHGDYAAAAQAAGYSYTSYTCLVSEARTAFFALWHEGEAPSRIWSTDQGGDGDIEDRVRHVLAARRRTVRGTGRHHDQEAGGNAELPCSERSLG